MRVLAFHDVPSESLRNFRTQIEYLKKATNIVSLDDFFAGRLSSTKINVALTFDDGYQSWVEGVAPILRELSVSATFFISSGFLRRSDTEREVGDGGAASESPASPIMLSVDGIRDLANQGFCIGGHTRNHVDLSAIKDSTCSTCILAEIRDDKEALESISGARVEYFAYPFGFHENRSVDLQKLLHESGYRAALTLVPGFVTPMSNVYFMRRDVVRPTMPIPVFKARLFGNYDGVVFLKRLVG
jgi:peptidoglycan/xylan/chitin deacetylase (PgdA/CDA1 family)